MMDVADADLAGHVACDAGEDDLLRTEPGYTLPKPNQPNRLQNVPQKIFFLEICNSYKRT